MIGDALFEEAFRSFAVGNEGEEGKLTLSAITVVSSERERVREA